jgi:D-alanyl-lipoteichoic acid acyltransferase DltB (MBOAT superfamily)
MIGVVKATLSLISGQQFSRSIFDQPQLYSSLETLVAIYGYALQIYCDFRLHGHRDWLSAVAGIQAAREFQFALSRPGVIDFWRRWHITLSDWLRDYLFVSIGGLRKRRFNLYRNVVLTMLIAGLWHGAAWTFLLWGVWQGFGLSVNHLWEAHRRKHHRKPHQQWWIKTICVVITFHLSVWVGCVSPVACAPGSCDAVGAWQFNTMIRRRLSSS